MSADKIQNTSVNVDLSAYDPQKYCHPEHLGGEGITTGGEDHLVIRRGGADDQTDTGQSGGRSIA
jgi:hypothetical protein